MPSRLTLCGIFMMLGLWSMGWWTPLPWTMWGGTCAFMALLLCCYRHPLSDGPLYLAMLCIGCTMSLRLQPADCDPTQIRGRVESRMGRQALVSSQCGRWELQFADSAPPKGTLLAARTLPAKLPPQLPGEPSEPARIRRIRATPVRVIAWTPISEAPSPRPDVYDAFVHGGLLWAFASGERGEIDPDIKQLLKDTGTNHLLAISGMHIGLVAGMVFGVVRWLLGPLIVRRWYWTALILPRCCGCAVAIAYGAMVGWPASAQRAVMMVCLISVGSIFGKKWAVGPILTLVALAILIHEPAELVSLGFQLSFGAVIGMALIVRRVTRLIPPDTPSWIRWIAQSLGATLGATLGTLPVTAWYFQHFAPLSPLANLLAAPILAMVAVPAALLAFVLPPQLGYGVLWIGNAAIELGLWLLEGIRTDPWHPAVGAWGALGLGLAVLLRKREWLMLGGIFCILLQGPRRVSGLEISFLNVGQGDAALLAWPDGAHWLVDGGPSHSRILSYLRREKIRKLDVVVVSHAHQDHIAGIVGLGDFPVGEIWIPRFPADMASDFGQWLIQHSQAGSQIKTADEIVYPGIRILHPLKGWRASKGSILNEESLVMELTQLNCRILWTGDIESEAESAIVSSLRKVDLLKVAHHGSRKSSSAAVLDQLQPQAAIISAGQDNRFKHPHHESLWRLQNSQVWRTDQQESIRVLLRPNQMIIQGAKSQSKLQCVTNQG